MECIRGDCECDYDDFCDCGSDCTCGCEENPIETEMRRMIREGNSIEIIPAYEYSVHTMKVRDDGDDLFGTTFTGSLYGPPEGHVDVYGTYISFESPFEINQIETKIRQNVYNEFKSREWCCDIWGYTSNWPPINQN
jgi:hypothetical protein